LITVGVTEKNVKLDLGVLDAQEGIVSNFREKPSIIFKVSMGIYCMEPGILELIPEGMAFGFDDLMYEMLERQMPIHVFEHHGLWWDIGREEDFRHAQTVFTKEYKSIILGC
jgi:mannose-1-phosphate guanylyltransferase